MVKIISKKIVFFILAIFLISTISATFSKGNLTYSINKMYGPNDKISGWINISLINEPTNSIFKSSLGDTEITLSNLLAKSLNSGFLYNCQPTNCDSDYAGSNSAVSKSATLEAKGSALFGLKISGDEVSDISDFSLKVTSNVGESILLPLSIDILNDGEIEWKAHTISSNFGVESYGCFEEEDVVGQANLIQTTYCEKMTIPQAPAIDIGAYVIGTGNINFVMSIESMDGSEYESCTAPASGSGRVNCTLSDFIIGEEKDYFVCIQAKSSADSNRYKIDYEQEASCGFSGSYQNKYNYDFKIFVKPKKFGAVGTFTLNNDELSAAGNDMDVEAYIADYIYSQYNNNCSKDCFIPIKFVIGGGASQQIDLSEVSLTYTSGISTTTNRLYDIQETPAQISSTFQKLYLDEAGFKVPGNYGNQTFSLKLKDTTIFSQIISVEPVPRIRFLTPTITAAKYPTKFRVLVNSSSSIKLYEWDFGTGTSKTSTTNGITYTYDTAGEYPVKITITDVKNKSSSKTFNVTVGSASTIIPLLLEEKRVNIDSIEAQIAELSSFQQRGLNMVLNVSRNADKIEELNKSFSTVATEEDYEAIMTALLGMEVPLMVATTTTTDSFVFYPETNNIDLEVLKQIGGGDYEAGKEEEYAETILGWEGDNVDVILSYDEISAVYEKYDEPVLKVFEITVSKKGESTGNPYLIIRSMENLLFEGDYSEKQQSGYFYIDLTEDEKTIRFSTTEDVDFVNLPMFISPAITELSIQQPWSPYDEKGSLKKWIVYVIILFLLLGSGVVVYILLQIWYTKKYEEHLFKNRNNLYNIINFIEQSKRKGMSERDIIAKLRKAGWKNEQLRYALKKYAGKKTGMPFEFPIKSLGKKEPAKSTVNKNEFLNRTH
ncbi:MAG: PKD domain-containing protein [Candidatus Pacearchaeota archaeon]|nr:PKD domain-containing protein [Candidatus Pacearchaeota archaeon]